MSELTSEMISKNQHVAKVIPIQIRKDTRGVSRELPVDPFENMYNDGGIIEPPYDLFTLAVMSEVSSELGPVIEAMTVNIAKMGHRIISRDGMKQGEDSLDASIKAEIAKVRNFFDNAVLNPTETFTTFRSNIRNDLENTGNGYFEILPNLITLEPAGLNHLPSWQMRLRKEDEEMTEHEVIRAVQGSNGSWSIEKFPYSKRFRRYVQIRESENTKVYFKEWGDPRPISKITGEVFTDEEMRASDWYEGLLATEVVHVKLYCPRSPYGLPRWIGNLFTIYGNRAAEVINYTTFRNNNIPAMMLLGTNVQLSDGSIERIRQFVEERIQGDDNYSTILIVEAEPLSEGMRDPGTMKLDIKELTQVQHTDALFKEYMDRNDDKIRRAFRLPPIIVGRCVPIETEFLTINGWKTFENIRDDEEIATVDNNGKLEYQIPLNRHLYDYSGNLLRISNGKSMDVIVTHNHRMMQKDHRSDKWEFEEAQYLKKWHREFMLASLEWNGEQKDVMEIPQIYRKNKCDLNKLKNKSVYDMNLFLEFLGYYISEGSISSDNYAITFSQNSGWLADRMIEVVREMGFDPCVCVSRGNQLNISFSDISLCTWLKEYCGKDCKNKRFPRWILDLSRVHLQIFYNSLMNGDGHWCDVGRYNSGCYSIASKILSDLFQELCFKLGYRSTTRYIDRSNAKLSDIWTITVSSNPINHCCDVYGMIEEFEYDGKVCCFTTPNGTIVTRNNGHIMISGNSDDYTRSTADSSRKVAEEQVFRPNRNEDDAVWNQTILPALNTPNVVFRSNTPDITDNYELTQLLAVAEQSGGLSPNISRIITEDVLGRDLPPISEDIPADIPFSLTMIREQIKAEAEYSGLTDGDVVKQLNKLKNMMDDNEDIPEEAHNSINTLIKLMNIQNDNNKLNFGNKSENVNKTIRQVDGQYCVFSEDGDTNFGCYDTKGEAEDRLSQIERFSEKCMNVKLTNVFKVVDEDKDEQIIGGAVLVPGVVDLQGEIYDADTTEAAAYYWLEHYMEDTKENGIKFMHKGVTIYDAARPIQSWVLDRDMEFEVEVPAVVDGHPSKELIKLKYPKGTWMLYARVNDLELWDMFKSGKLIGWSIGGVALVQSLKYRR